MMSREERKEREAWITGTAALILVLFLCAWSYVALHFIIKFW